MNHSQRTVVVVALGVVIAAAVNGVNHSVELTGGWFNYAPNSGLLFDQDAVLNNNHFWPETLWWLLGALVWAGLSVWIYRDRPRPSTDD
ncbi:MAG TPA: hypothetical protein VJM33_06630 [Microthrixaceae bacterium]|nr:hypothetical protein [Microthrixaceae bacterium]